MRLILPLLLSLSLFSSLLSNVPVATAHATATALHAPKATQTFGKFLAHKAPTHKAFVNPKQPPSRWARELLKDPPKVLPSTEPVTMHALRQSLSPAYLTSTALTPAATGTPTVTRTSATSALMGTPATTGTPAATTTPATTGTSAVTATPTPTATPTATATPAATAIPTATATPASPLHLQSSDGRLTVTIPPGALDASQATLTSSHVTVASALMQSGVVLTINQLVGHSIDNVDSLGQYQFQFTDAQGHALSGLRLHAPLTIQYHYQPGEIQQMGLDPGSLLLTWPVEIRAALAANTPTTGLVVPMLNDAATQTLTAQVSTLGVVASVATGTVTNQAPPKPLAASVQPNTGQLSYTYPITVAPGPNGTTPTVQLVYSSAATNGRHEPTSPADSPGDGWGLSLGSITATTYPPAARPVAPGISSMASIMSAIA